MTVIHPLNVEISTDAKASLVSLSMRKEFQKWLAKSKARKKYTAKFLLSSMDKISEYALHNEISPISLWEYTQFNAFKSIYKKLSKAKTLRVSDKKNIQGFLSLQGRYIWSF